MAAVSRVISYRCFRRKGIKYFVQNEEITTKSSSKQIVCLQPGYAVTMETSDEENFVVAISSPSDAEFDAVVGYLEDIIMDDDFQLIQRTFMEKHYQEFDDSEENKLIYTSIFNEYISLVEKYIEEKLLDQIPGFNMTAFTLSLQQHKDEIAGDIFDMLLTFTDFLAFKEMFLDYRAMEARLCSGLDITVGGVTATLIQGLPHNILLKFEFTYRWVWEKINALLDIFRTHSKLHAITDAQEKEGRSLDLSSGLVVTSLNKSSISSS